MRRALNATRRISLSSEIVLALDHDKIGDMPPWWKHCKNLLADGRCFIVVGNSAFAGVIIPTDVILANLALECGFKKAEILVARHLTVAPQQRNQLAHLEDNMRESVVVLS